MSFGLGDRKIIGDRSNFSDRVVKKKEHVQTVLRNLVRIEGEGWCGCRVMWGEEGRFILRWE